MRELRKEFGHCSWVRVSTGRYLVGTIKPVFHKVLWGGGEQREHGMKRKESKVGWPGKKLF